MRPSVKKSLVRIRRDLMAAQSTPTELETQIEISIMQNGGKAGLFLVDGLTILMLLRSSSPSETMTRWASMPSCLAYHPLVRYELSQ